MPLFGKSKSGFEDEYRHEVGKNLQCCNKYWKEKENWSDLESQQGSVRPVSPPLRSSWTAQTLVRWSWIPKSTLRPVVREQAVQDADLSSYHWTTAPEIVYCSQTKVNHEQRRDSRAREEVETMRQTFAHLPLHTKRSWGIPRYSISPPKHLAMHTILFQILQFTSPLNLIFPDTDFPISLAFHPPQSPSEHRST